VQVLQDTFPLCHTAAYFGGADPLVSRPPKVGDQPAQQTRRNQRHEEARGSIHHRHRLAEGEPSADDPGQPEEGGQVEEVGADDDADAHVNGPGEHCGSSGSDLGPVSPEGREQTEQPCSQAELEAEATEAPDQELAGGEGCGQRPNEREDRKACGRLRT